MTDYYNNDIKLNVEGKEVFLTAATITELHRQENIQWGKDIVANYIDDILTDSQYELIAKRLEHLMMESNGDLEQKAIDFVLRKEK